MPTAKPSVEGGGNPPGGEGTGREACGPEAAKAGHRSSARHAVRFLPPDAARFDPVIGRRVTMFFSFRPWMTTEIMSWQRLLDDSVRRAAIPARSWSELDGRRRFERPGTPEGGGTGASGPPHRDRRPGVLEPRGVSTTSTGAGRPAALHGTFRCRSGPAPNRPAEPQPTWSDEREIEVPAAWSGADRAVRRARGERPRWSASTVPRSAPARTPHLASEFDLTPPVCGEHQHPAADRRQWSGRERHRGSGRVVGMRSHLLRPPLRDGSRAPRDVDVVAYVSDPGRRPRGWAPRSSRVRLVTGRPRVDVLVGARR